MKHVKTLLIPLFLASLCLLLFSALAQNKWLQKHFKQQVPFKLEPVYFQEWYSGIKIGGTGINVFIPISDEAQDVALEAVYFRNLKGKLVQKGDKYMAILKNPSPYYTFKKAKKPADYPFTLSDNECVISYVENGQIKFYRIPRLNEYAGTYYENGPPSLYLNTKSSELATIDEESNK